MPGGSRPSTVASGAKLLTWATALKQVGSFQKRVEIWTETRQNVPKFKVFFLEIETAIDKIRQIVVACGLFRLQFPEGSVLGNPPEII